jgi:hypothetical protein
MASNADIRSSILPTRPSMPLNPASIAVNRFSSAVKPALERAETKLQVLDFRCHTHDAGAEQLEPDLSSLTVPSRLYQVYTKLDVPIPS